MKTTKAAVSLASVLTIVLGMSAAYAASPAPEAELNSQTEAATGGKYSEDRAHTGKAKAEVRAEVRANDEVADDLKDNLREADASLRETADEIRAFFVGDEGGNAIEPVMIRTNRTAHGLLDQPVLNPNGKEITKLTDIIVDKDGKAVLAVVSDGGFLGIGNKVAAFDYSKVVTQHEDGKVVMALSQSMIDEAADFSYDRDDAAKAKVIPAGSFSVKDILDGELLNNKGDDVGTIDNLSFDNGKADRLIVGFNKKLGMGGDLAALSYSVLEKIRNTGEVDLQMNAKQSAQFAAFGKQSMK